MITQKVLSNFLGYHSLVTLLKAYLNIVFDYPYYSKSNKRFLVGHNLRGKVSCER